jgi:ABC-2 type transport system ATP-binding protein
MRSIYVHLIATSSIPFFIIRKVFTGRKERWGRTILWIKTILMKTLALQTYNISKKYGNINALDNVSLQIEKGQIYGLIGLNGSGKSTFMRIVCGLISATNGHIELFGQSDQKALQKQRSKIGQSVETPALYPELTAVQNLEIQRITGGIKDKSVVKKTLETVGLEDTGKKPAKNFSLGMKQRLALAISLITQPEFLILDEPTNGLDPVGIIETRNIIRKLAAEKGFTILVSSHLLDELSQVATNYGIIHKGKLIRQLSADELQNETKRYIKIKTENTQSAAAFLSNTFNIKCQFIPPNEIRVLEQMDRISEYNQSLVNAGYAVQHLATNESSLEEYFINTTTLSE